ncbi:phenylalanine--tRNA ligase subunit beta [Rhodovulum sp. DZ06]|uniref:phenylalanine--tRNA ligase subunit beta n=1 Tax=Rhodovulum sp. DZ06 TaxID=3425126 RepID=UPI003D328275
MKFTLSWLKEHLETEASLDQILDALTDLGLEVEGVEDPAETLGCFTICRVKHAEKHPDADKLNLCKVEAWLDGPDKPPHEIQVVCGAPNARTGLVGVFANNGDYVPGTDLLLKPTKIRGVESNGMLCSERELMISDDHDGIIDLPEDAPLGARFIDYAGLNDPVIEIAITPNRPDALGVAGVARDLAARGIGTLKTPAIEAIPGGYESPIRVELAPEVADKACPLFVGRYIRGVKNGPSPDWVQRRLKAIGLRPISALVDVTNLLTYDRNRPLHVFDADKVHGGVIRARSAQHNEELLALDGKTYRLEPGMTVIADEAMAEGIGGVMGGEVSGCTEDTVNVFVESAYFDPIRTAMTGRALKINSDARYRFERGIDPEFTRDGLELATKLILDWCGGEASEVVVAGAVPDTARAYRVDPARVQSLVGMDIPEAEQRASLTALGFRIEETADGLMAHVPSWRPDILGEADLVEEVARVASLTKLPATPLPRPAAGVTAKTLTPMQQRQRTARRALAALGFNECVTYSFVAEKEAKLFGGGDDAMRLENPISSELSHMRPDPLPALLAAAARNQARGMGDLALFEVGPGFTGGEPGEQRLVASGVITGATAPRHWSGARRPVDMYDAKGAVTAVLEAIGAPTARLMVRREASEWYHPGRSALLSLGPKNVLAEFGELHPKVLDAMDVKGSAMAFTILLENPPFPKKAGPNRGALDASDLQAVERDFAFVVDAEVEAETMLRAARSAEKKLIEDAAVFDIFEGKKAAESLGEGKKSVALSVRLQPRDKTLTEKEIEAVADKVVAAVVKATGGALRG